MSALIEPAELADESELVWLEDITALDYVRQSLDRLPDRHDRPRHQRAGRLVGYAVLHPDAPASPASGTFRRRVFWLLPHDRDTRPEGPYAYGAPSESVDPRTVGPGWRGSQTPRCVAAADRPAAWQDTPGLPPG
ncbi:DUF6009 family protein [Kitasatospora saccharophila]|uniref:DUF6009 family protein n=1 Tax=Kitasatospora saccharophila TaxID=407973 RepID=A0ABP5JDD9_9ACTN